MTNKITDDLSRISATPLRAAAAKLRVEDGRTQRETSWPCMNMTSLHESVHCRLKQAPPSISFATHLTMGIQL